MRNISHIDPPTPETPIRHNVLHEIANVALIIYVLDLSALPSVNLDRPINPLHERPTREEADGTYAMH